MTFEKLLIANRSEVALRVMRTCRQMGIATVAVYSEADADSLHVAAADESYALGPAPLAQSYLNQDAVLDALARSGADAVHPGYGLLSENAEFAGRVRAAGATFVGPDTETLAAFGDKLRARELAGAQGIRPPPGSREAVDPARSEALQAAALDVGFPLLVKATAGGGGIGMAIVQDPSELAAAATRCSQRAQSAFGDSRVYLEKYLDRPRHLEVQILGDAAGCSHALGERECSVQRRHQKLVEECPSPAAFLRQRNSARDELLDAARSLLGSRSYRGLATVEFVVDGEGSPYFLEVNPRLQVEHGVTEMVFGIDLVKLQLEAVAGQPSSLGEPTPRGHALEVRLYAEDPDKNFMPQPGTLQRFRFPEGRSDLRVETGFREGDVVTPYYDPLLAKVLTWGNTRDEAIENMRNALDASEVEIVGKASKKRSNLELLRNVLDQPDFVSGDYTTHLVSRMQA